MPSNVPLLEYASRHTQVRQYVDRTVITVPPDRGWGFWVWVVIVGGVGFVTLIASYWPGGITRTPIGVVRHPGGVMPRVISLALTVFIVTCIRAAWRIRSGDTTLTVRGRTLTLATPSVFGTKEVSYDLNRWVDADVQCDTGDSSSLWLHGKDGRSMTPLLHVDHYPESELELAAQALRDEMTRARLANEVSFR